MMALVALGGCAVQQPTPTKLEAHPPRSIVVVPPLNDTTDVSAPGVFMPTVTIPLAERGYYVFPIHLTDALLKDLGLPEAGLVHQLPPQRFLDLFGADAVLFIKIEDWGNKYMVLQHVQTVEIAYVLRDTRTGEVLWQREETVSRGSGSGGDPIGAVISAALDYLLAEMLETDFGPLAAEANYRAFTASRTGLPPGPRSPEYGADRGAPRR